MCTPAANLEGCRPGLTRFVPPLRSQHVALKAPLGEKLRQIGQVLRGRGMIGPVILIDEEDSPRRGWTRLLAPHDVGRCASRRGPDRRPSRSILHLRMRRGAVRLCRGGCPAAASGARSPCFSAWTLLQALRVNPLFCSSGGRTAHPLLLKKASWTFLRLRPGGRHYGRAAPGCQRNSLQSMMTGHPL